MSRRVGLRTIQSVGGKVPYAPEFYDGFETGDFSKWTIATDALIIASPVHHGNYAARGNTYGILQHALSPVSRTYFSRIFFYASQLLLGGADYTGFLRNHAHVGEIVQIGLQRVGAVYYLYWINTLGTNALITGTTPITEGWHCLELEAHHAIGQTNRVWLDGALEFEDAIIFDPGGSIITLEVNPTDATPRVDIDCVIGDIIRPTCAYHSDIKV